MSKASEPNRSAESLYQTIDTIHAEHNVFLVKNRESGRICVKKILEVYNREIFRLLQERRIPGVPEVLEVWEENGLLIVIEEYVSGRTLRELIEDRLLTEDRILRYTEELCDILERLHRLNPPVIHRDIKPSNLMITPEDHVVLMDFNAARFQSFQKGSDTVLLGTQGYAAPEQYGFGESTPRTDIYALGVLLKEMEESLFLPTPRFDAVISRCTRLDPADRFESVQELRDALDLAGETPENTDGAADEAPDSPEGFFREGTRSFRAFLPPGYRGFRPWKMAAATLGYALILYTCSEMEFRGARGAALLTARILFSITVLSGIFVHFNYLGVHRFMPLCASPEKSWYWLGVFLEDAVVVSVLFFLTVLFELLVT